MAQRITLVGAYGRQYLTKEQAINAWNQGKDFKILNGPYCSKRDIGVMLRTNDEVCILISTGEQIRIFS